LNRTVAIGLWVAAGVVAIVAVLLVLAWRPAIAAIGRPSAAGFARASIERGAALAHVGDCAVCHTAGGGAPYVGGRAIPTPFGQIYSTNITPDAATGIGGWSLAAFRRALRQGVARDGAHLYPAFPYDHFGELRDADIADLYAFLMTRQAVKAEAPPNRLIFPLGFRPLLAGWKLLFLRLRPIADDPGKSADWNRGRYLVEALGHCGACHTPHNSLGAEQKAQAFAGGWAEGWYAPPLTAASPAAGAWTADELHRYLRTGLSNAHAAAAGPMGPVANELAAAPDAEVQAIAAYVADLTHGARAHAAAPVDHTAVAAREHPAAATLFAGACAACHEAGAPMMGEGRPELSLGTPLREANPRDTLQIILQGLRPPVGRAGPAMPGFGAAFDDAQLADLAAYLRTRYTDGPPWPGDLAHEAAKARREGGS
jgi:mono/diheme cytochrome c family protein